MSSKEHEVHERDVFENFSRQDLIDELKSARFETYRYINNLLEVEQKWMFVNYLLAKLNSIKDVDILSKTICDGFLKLTNSKICACYLFNPDDSEVTVKQHAFEKSYENQDVFFKFIDEVNAQCSKFIQEGTRKDKVNEYFEKISSNTAIIVPIIYSADLLGYLILVKDEENFYNDNIHFINIFPEHIALILVNLHLYNDSEMRNRHKIEFLAGISHEFKTPLNSIIGFADILRGDTRENKQLKYLDNISKSSKHLLSLIEDVLDVSKSQFNALELNYSRFNTKEEIVQIISAFEKMVEEKEIQLDFTLCDMTISADLKRFRQLIFNLISNAVKFNKIRGNITILSYMEDGNFAFEISDTGDGISKKDYNKIFDFFSQVNRNQLKRQLGSGVGLALCKMITDAHKGQIGFKSQLKKGSSFWFSLPIEK